jgi:hypothetical protein
VDSSPNPASRRFEWKGKAGALQYYDKQKQENVPVKLPFTFILLDRTATVTGYNKKAKTGIYANEVRDTRSDPFVVKMFQGGIVAQGVWADIKDKVTSRAMGGCFALNCYMAFKDGEDLKIGVIKMSGCALGPWFEFEKEHRKLVESPSGGDKVQEIYAKAIVMKKGEANDAGEIAFVPPVFSVAAIAEETNTAALELDGQLQSYLTGYFGKPHSERVAGHEAERPQADAGGDGRQEDAPENTPEPEDSDMPF